MDFPENLIACIQADDLASFRSYESKYDLPALRLGRFPILSIVYLFSAKKIASYCEEKYLRYNAWEEEQEPFILSYVFSKKAGRALRLYVNEVVSPLEMLLLLDKTKKLRRLYPLARPSQAQKARLTSVWSVLYSLRVTCLPDKIEIEKRPRTPYERRRAIMSACSVVLCVAILAVTPFVVNVFYPFINASNNQQNQNSGSQNGNEQGQEQQQEPQPEEETIKYYFVSSVSDIDFASKNVYTLTQDVLIPDDSYTEEMNCTVRGADHAIVLSSLSPLFGTIKGTMENVRLSIETSGTVTQDTAFLASSNEGKLDNVSLSVRGSLQYKKGDGDSITVAGLVSSNVRGGKILSCSVDCDLTLTGQTQANGTFVGVCASNNGEIGNCTSTGTITSDCVDLAGICHTNDYYLHDCLNRCALTQSVSVREWNPICAGVALINNYSTTVCRNEGAISVTSTYVTEGELSQNTQFAEAIAGGVVANNHYSITNCANAGTITSTAEECVCYAAGIAAICAPTTSGFLVYPPSLKTCTNTGATSVSCNRITGFAGGIVAYGSQSYFDGCTNGEGGNVSVVIADCTLNVFVCVGGIGGNAEGCSFSACENNAPVTVNAVITYAYVGGLAGKGGTLANGKNTSDVYLQGTLSYAYLGGVAASSSGSVSSSSCTGNVSLSGTNASVYAGGIAAFASGSVSSSSCSGNLSVSGTNATVYVGGILAIVNAGSVASCSYAGEITAEGDALYAGGIAALSYLTISSSYVTGQLTATGKEVRAGGILGFSPITLQSSRVYCGDVSGCLSEMNLEVSATDISFAGGILGYGKGEQYYRGSDPLYRGAAVTDSFFTGTITGENVYKGTIFGGCDEYIFKKMRDDKQNFENDLVLSADPVAVGAYKPTDSEEYVVGGTPEGVSVQTLEEMQENETYKALIEKFVEP